MEPLPVWAGGFFAPVGNYNALQSAKLQRKPALKARVEGTEQAKLQRKPALKSAR
jgi:hypothetical protein